MEHNNQRRAFLKALAVGAGAIALAPVISIKNALAAEHVKLTDPMVKALGYVEDVSKEKKKDASFKAGSKCQNCQFYADAKAKTSGCQMFQGKEVNAGGWCRSYTKHA